MIRKAFLKRMALAVLGSGMLADALSREITITLDPLTHHYIIDEYGLSFKVSKQMIEDDCYNQYVAKIDNTDWRAIHGSD